MDGITGVAGGAMDIAANGSSSIAMAVLAGTEALMANEAARLMASLGVGANVNLTA